MFAKKIAVLIAAVSLMAVGASAAMAETTTDGNKTHEYEESKVVAYVEDTNAGAEASYCSVHSTEKYEYGSLEGTLESAKAEIQVGTECKAAAEATFIEYKATVGVESVGSVGGSLEMGVGGHIDAGYNDGHLKLDVGLALGVGGSLSIDINVGGIWHSICSWF